jgi:hypothetical protein
MLKHIVVWKFLTFAEGADKKQNLLKAKALLESLKVSIKEIRFLEVGLDLTHTERSYDLVLYTEFDSREALVAYQQNAEHVKVVEFLRKVQSGRGVIDYETKTDR